MVKQRMDLLELLRKRGMDGDVDLLREALRVLVDGIMDAEVSAQIGAQHGERSPERVTYRNGYRNRTWDTRVGTMELHIPKLREGSYFPSLLEPRRRSEKALLAVIQQAYVEGVSTRRVDDLIKALGCDGISSSQVSRICEQLDEVVESFLGRPLDGGPYPYVWLDGLTQKVREGGRIVNVCVVVATGVNAEGQREILGMDVGASEDGAFWLAFLRSLTARGLSGVELVTSDAHQGLKNAIAAVFDRRQLVLLVTTTIFAGRYGVIIRYGGTVDYRPTNQAIEAETYGRQDTGNGSGQGWDERAFSAQVAEWAIAVAGETGASVAHSAGSLRRGVGG